MTNNIDGYQVSVEPSSLDQPKLPNMNEFSPGTLGSNNIKEFLEELFRCSGNREAMINQIELTVPKITKTENPKQRKTRAGNVLIGMSECGLLFKKGKKITGEFTDLANRIVKCKTHKKANEVFALHILQNCHGLELFDTISVIGSRGETIAPQSIREELRTRGFKVLRTQEISQRFVYGLKVQG